MNKQMARENSEIVLIIRNEENEFMDRELVAKLVPVEGGVFTAKGEREYEGFMSKKDVLEFEKVFLRAKGLSRECREFVERFLPYRKGLRKLEKKGYSVDFILHPSEDDYPSIEQKIILERSFLQMLAKMGLHFALAFGMASGIKQKRLKKYKKLDKFERKFLRKHMKADYCTCRVYCFERGEPFSRYKHEFVYRSQKKKLAGLEYSLAQVKERFKAGALKRPYFLQIYSYHAWYGEWLWMSPKLLQKLSKFKVDVEFNWYSGGFVRY